MIITKLDSRCA